MTRRLEDQPPEFQQPTDGSCEVPLSCQTRCQSALAVFINPNHQPTCTHPEVADALEKRESGEWD